MHPRLHKVWRPNKSAIHLLIQHDQISAMPKITYIEHDGTQHTVEGEIGATVMETALRHSVPGIVAECGGSCTCATCMVYVAEEWKDRLGARSDEEEDQLDQAFDVRPTSRLSCQIKVTEEID